MALLSVPCSYVHPNTKQDLITLNIFTIMRLCYPMKGREAPCKVPLINTYYLHT